MNQQEIINTIALTRLGYFSLASMLRLYREVGSATEILQHRHDIRTILPEASDRLVEALRQMDDPMRRAEAEYAFDEAHKIRPIVLSDPDYPERLRQCDDAPLVIFYRGTANLNAAHIVSIVGTRQMTSYGQELIQRFVADLKRLLPDVIVLSGLAYGVDICAHRAALDNGLDTIGVLAHGLDTIYPNLHRPEAERMLTQGGLLTEYLTATKADKMNFVRRNRIVAGMADATVLVESAAHGGGLITASIARSYDREVFAFPGSVGAKYSEGCNQLIRQNGAVLLTSAADLLDTMGWTNELARQQALESGIERQMFPDLTDEESTVVEALKRHNDLQVNMLAVQTDIPISRLVALLFSLEMKGVVRTMAGGTYHLLTL